MLQYQGAGKRLTSQDVVNAAKEINVPVESVQAIMDVETNGHGFDSMGHPTFLFEPHKFYEQLSSNKTLLNLAIKQGLAYKSWKGPGSYPKTVAARWDQFQKACMIDETAAISAASWGLGQIMGSEFEEAGYESPEEMVASFADSEGEQVLGMVRLIKHRGLDADMRRFPQLSAAEHFALRYNGKAYAKNSYHTKIVSAWNRRHVAALAKVPQVPEDGVLRVGSRGSRVEALQNMLIDKGYKLGGKVDGIFGNFTRDAVNAWKSDNQRTADGQMDQQDLQDLEDGPSRPVNLERATTTAAELKKDSGIVQTTSTAKKTGWGLGSVFALAEGANHADLLDTAQNGIDKAQQAKGIWQSAHDLLQTSGIASILGFVIEYRFAILCVAVVVGVFAFNRIEKLRVKMHQEAEVA